MCDLTKYITCSRCGHSRIIASGYCATEMTRDIWLQTLRKIGWTTAGLPRCRTCSAPLDATELMEYLNLKNARKSGDMGIVHFKKRMWKKYGEAVELFFATPDEPSEILKGYKK